MLILGKEAERDLQVAYGWYAGERAELGVAFMAEVEKGLDAIVRHPSRFAVVKRSVRRALCRKFPYAIYFVVAEEHTMVLAVLHQRQHPSRWQRRI